MYKREKEVERKNREKEGSRWSLQKEGFGGGKEKAGRFATACLLFDFLNNSN